MSRLNLTLGVLAILLIAASAMIGTADLSADDLWSGLLGQTGPSSIIIWEIRMPRAVAAFVTGASLGLAGAALQGLLRNPLADPGVLGVSAFASLGAVIALYFGLASLTWLAVPLLAIGFSVVAVILLLVAAGPKGDTVRTLLVGIGLSSAGGAMIALALNLAPNPYSLADLMNWLLGSVSNRSWADIVLVLPVMALGLGIVLVAGPGLRALSLGDETAASLGARPGRTRALVIAGTSLLTGASVAIAGAIGFVGIVAPHIVRPFVRSDPARLLVPSALLAGVILLGADIVIRVLPFDRELRLGVAAALFGAPVFIWISARLTRGRL
ncbi:FecCD family ABC transporter permease [Henriciella litoralis]|uniref:FecCD family ABC transporter permease n=1 Tax=Henriciella litoralis TaxID=568102 RepID=UPI000A04C2C6|nr:iron ABC transporter permease [Henriciella litoralis]